MTDQFSPARRITGTAGGLVLAALTLAACSGSSGASPAAPSPAGGTSSSAAAGAGAANGQRGAFAGGSAASGTIAEIDGNTVQVQSTSAQTAVDVTAKTAYTIREKTSLAAVKVGVCVVATSTSGSPAASPTSIAATSVAISPATGASCTGGFGGGAGGAGGVFPGGGTGTRPSGFPSGFPRAGRSGGTRPSGAPSGRRTFGGVVAGKVTAVSGSTITVQSIRRARGSSSSSTTTAAPTPATITVTAATTYTTTAKASKASMKVGLCANAFGKSDSSGAVTATRLDLSSPVSGSCTTGFAGRGGGPNG